jgi:hypothetical protein
MKVFISRSFLKDGFLDIVLVVSTFAYGLLNVSTYFLWTAESFSRNPLLGIRKLPCI